MKKIVSFPVESENASPVKRFRFADETDVSPEKRLKTNFSEIEMPIFADPKYDITFKKIFTDSVCLISFLNNVLGLEEEHKITKVEITDPYLQPDQTEPSGSEKQSILDVRATDHLGKEYIIEMQRRIEKSFVKRGLYYSSKIIGSGLFPRDGYDKTKEVVFIGVLDFVLFPKIPGYFRYFVLKDRHSELEIDAFNLIFLELKKFVYEVDKQPSELDLWLHLLRSAQDMDKIPSEFQRVPAINRAMGHLETSRWDSPDRDLYYREALTEMKRRGELEAALESGMEKGREEAYLTVLKNLLSQDISVESICTTLGVSKSEYTSLLEKLHAKKPDVEGDGLASASASSEEDGSHSSGFES